VIIASFVFLNLFVAVIISQMEKLNKKNDAKEESSSTDVKIDQLIDKISSLENEIKELRSSQKSL
jgi:hypothetical protein